MNNIQKWEELKCLNKEIESLPRLVRNTVFPSDGVKALLHTLKLPIAVRSSSNYGSV